MSRYQFPSAGTTTTDASLLVSGTLDDARLSSNVALENVANVFTAKQSFSGTNHVGLCLNSLTTAQYNALTATNGDLFRDSTTDRIDARLARGTVELVDTAGGQQINGALGVTGNITLSTGVVVTSGSAGVGVLTINNDGNSRWVYNGGEFIVGGAIRPSTTNARTLGTSGQRWSTVFGVAGDFSGNLTASGTVTAASAILGATSAAGVRDSSGPRVYWDGNGSGATRLVSDGSIFLERFANNGVVDIGTSGAFSLRLVRGGTAQVTLASGSTDVTGNLTASGTVTASGTGTHTFGTTNTVTMAAGNLTASGTVRVGGGTVVQTILSATATLDFPSISSNDTHTLTITVTGAVAGDSVFLGVPAGLDAGLIFCGSVTAANTVTVRMHNSSGGSIDPASGTFRATVIRF